MDSTLSYEDLLAENQKLKQQISVLENSKTSEAKDLLKLLMNSLPIIIAYIDSDFRYVHANNHFKTLHGIDPKDMIGKTVHEVIGDDGWEVEKEKYHRVLNGEKVVSIDKFTTKIGVFHWYQVTLIPHFEDENVKGIFGLVVDLTDQKNMENELRNREKSLKKMNATKNKFFSIISHDLKAPLNNIVGFSNLIEKSIQKKAYGELENHAHFIHKASQRTLNLLINLLDWSKTQTDQITFNPEPTDLNDLVMESIDLLKSSASQKSILIISDIPKNTILYIDRFMIKSVLRNLISNAIKFTNKRGRIALTLKRNDLEHTITVSDTGIGISEQTVDKLLKIDASHSTVGTAGEMGTGLGLILSKEFIEKHDGKIWVDSEVGVGSSFHFSLPIHKYKH